METNVLHFLPTKSHPPTIPINTNPSTVTTRKQPQIFLPRRGQSWRFNATADSPSNDDTPQPVSPTITPRGNVEIRFKRGSKRRSRKLRGDSVSSGQPVKAQASDPPKKWEDMSLTEKVIDLYLGEKGLLFWLNKFAYACIFIVIGGWILFRFVGPALNLYQLDTPPLSPSSVFKGS